jgi:MFS family permease
VPAAEPLPAPTLARGSRGGLALGLLFGWCTVLESGVMGWASVYLNQGLKASASLSGMGLAVFSCAMALGRLCSDRLVTRHGAALTVRAGAATCALALGFAASVPDLPTAFLAFAATGLGLAAAAPAIFSAAGRLSGEALALVAGMGAVGGLLGPLVLGRIAGLVSLNAVLAVLAIVSVIIAWQAAALAGDKPGASGLSPVAP